MKELNTLYKGAGKGKIAAIVHVSGAMVLSKLTVQGYTMLQYREYLINYVGYDDVYIIANKYKHNQICEEFNVPFVKVGIGAVNFLNDLEIDDIISLQNCYLFFGGIIDNRTYSALVKRLAEWYVEHGDGHFYVAQDDPELVDATPIDVIEEKLNTTGKLYHSKNTLPDIETYKQYIGVVKEMYENCIIAYCGNNYKLFHDNITKLNIKLNQHQTIPNIKYWTKFNVYTYTGVNYYIKEKLTNNSNKQYSIEYHGYLKSDKKRINKTLSFINGVKGNKLVIDGFKKSFSDKFENATHIGYMEYKNLISYLNETCYSTFITHSETVWNDFFSPRVFDCMLSNIIAFVDKDYDSNNYLTDNEELSNFMYVSSPDELNEKVNIIIKDKQYYDKIKYLQRKSIFDKFNGYMTEDTIKAFNDIGIY